MRNDEPDRVIGCLDRVRSDEQFRLETVLRRLLHAAEAGDRDRATRDFSIVARLYPASRSLRALERIARGERQVMQVDDVFLVNSDSVSAEIRANAIRDVRAACTAARELMGEMPLLVLELVANAPPLALLSADIPELRHLMMAGDRLTAANFTATLFHEIGHAVLTCGCRFLDEGWAVFFSYRGDAERAFPLPRRRVAGFVDQYRLDLIDLHALLGLPAIDDLTFDSVARNERQRRLIYVEAYLLVERIVRKFGMARLLALFAAIRQAADPPSTPLLFARILGQSAAQLQEESLPFQGKDAVTPLRPSYDGLLSSLMHAGDRAQALSAAIATLRRSRAGPSGLVPTTLVLAALLLAKLIGADPKEARLLRSEIEVLLMELQSAGEASTEFGRISECYAAMAAAAAARPVEQAIWQFRAAEMQRQRGSGKVREESVRKICDWALAATA